MSRESEALKKTAKSLQIEDAHFSEKCGKQQTSHYLCEFMRTLLTPAHHCVLIYLLTIRSFCGKSQGLIRVLEIYHFPW